jgi:hypothetical protein
MWTNILAVVQKIMRQVIADVPKYSSAEYRCCSMPVIEEDGMCQLPEWSRQCNEECRRHDKPILVHWKVVVNAMKEEMDG